MHRVTRRHFLRQALVGAAAIPAGLSLKAPVLWGEESPPQVCVAQGSNDDSAEGMLKTALEGLGGIGRFVKAGQVVAIKPNATWAFRPHTSSASDPDLLRALIQMVQAAGAKRVLVVDHCSIDPGTAEALRINGIGKVLDELGVEKVVPDRFNAPASTYVKIDLPNGKDFKKIGVIKAAVEADVRINLAVAKSHNVTKMSMCLKHMMGLMEVPQNLHTSIEQGIADINQPSPMQAQLHILEAIRVRWPYPNGQRVCAGPETDLTYPNLIKRMNTVVAGVDPVLIDAYGCIHFFESRPEELTHVLRAYESGVGQMDVERAIQEGRLRVFRVGQPVQTATPAITATEPAATLPAAPIQETAVQVAVPEEPPSTATPLPTASPIPESQAAGAAGVECATNEVVSPNAFLSGALIPVAVVILGAGIAVARRLGQGADE